jgi:hypothetical protein
MSSAGFKFGEDTGAQPRTVQKVAKVEPFIVGYTDNEGREQARIAFRIPGADATYILQERISGNQVVLPANQWFHKAFVDKLQSEGLEKTAGEAVDSI